MNIQHWTGVALVSPLKGTPPIVNKFTNLDYTFIQKFWILTCYANYKLISISLLEKSLRGHPKNIGDFPRYYN